jgi:hypothetical protein
MKHMVKEDLAARIILIAGLAIAVAVVVFWASLPFATIITYIPDDSFYYFQPASLMARGLIPSFDGVHPGNGFHPLWMFLLVPVFLLKSLDLYLPIHLSLLLAGLFYVFTAFNIYRILNLLGVNKVFSACAAATFVLFPHGFVRAVDGEVTPVNLLVLSFLLLGFIGLLGRQDSKPRQLVMLGIWSGLAYLARSDNIFLLALLLIFYLVQKSGNKNNLGELVWIIVPALIVALPWFIYNFAVFGTLIPTSIWAVPFINRSYMELLQPGLLNGLIYSARNVFESINHLLYFSPLNLGILFVYGLVFAQLVLAEGKVRQNSSLLMTLVLFVCILFLINTGIRLYLRDWHLGSALLINHLLLWYGLFLLAQKVKRKIIFAVSATCLLLLLYGVNLLYIAGKPIRPWQIEMWKAGQWAAQNPQTRFGAFNCGIIAYFGAGNVVDLDGNMNNSVFEAIKKHELYDYCRRENISCIMDYDSTVYGYYRIFWPASRLDRIVVISRQLDDPIVVYPHEETAGSEEGKDPFAAQIKGNFCIFALDYSDQQ